MDVTRKEQYHMSNKLHEKIIDLNDESSTSDNTPDMYKMSIVIPCYNVETYIEQCLGSVLKQTLEETEIICVNDGSTDNTLNLLKKFAEKDSRIFIIDKQNSGYGDSMNQGISFAHGQYIGIVESDDYIEPNMFETLYNTAIKHDADVVKSNFWLYWSNPEQNDFFEYFAKDECDKVITPSKHDGGSLYGRKPSIWSAIYKRSFLEKQNIRFLTTPGASYQDTSFTFKVYSTAQKMVCLYDAFLHYRQDNENSSINNAEKNMDYVLEEYREIESFINNNPQSEQEYLYPIYGAAFYDTCIWTYERLTPKSRYIFLKKISPLFKKLINDIGTDKLDFGDMWWKRRDIVRIAEEPYEYHMWRNEERYDQNAANITYQAAITPVNNIEQVKAMANSNDVPEFSVIVPVYNVEKYLSSSLDSLLYQSFENFEIICINDGSTDNSLSVIESYTKLDERIIIINQDNYGQSAARNIGLTAARGKYVLFLDSDDYLSENTLEIVKKEIEDKGNPDVVGFGGELFPDSPKASEWQYSLLTTPDKYYDKIDEKTFLATKFFGAFLWRYCFKMSFIRDNHLRFDEDMRNGEDARFLLYALPRVKGASVISDKLYHFRHTRVGSVTTQVSEDYMRFGEQQLSILEQLLITAVNELHFTPSTELLQYSCSFIYETVNNYPQPGRIDYINRLLSLFDKFKLNEHIDGCDEHCKLFYNNCINERNQMSVQKNDNEIFFGAETENKKFDVGIVGWWYNDNYGGTLTYYALNRLVKSMGYSVLMIERPQGDPNYVPNYTSVPRRFAKKYYNISKNYHPNKMGVLNNICSAFISGSDQLFSPYLWEYSGPPYYLDFAAPDKNIISYASSFGNSYSASEKFKMTISYYLRRFNALSVREDYGVDIMRENFNLPAKKVLDPVFVCDPAEYYKLTEKSSVEIKEKYYANFILDPDDEKRNAILYAKDKLNLPYVNLINALYFEENTKKFGLDNVKPNIDIEDFLNYYRNAEFIITDSFHGTCFAIIFRKPFISIANKQRGTGRFISLLNELGLQDRLVDDCSEIYSRPELFEKIDYTETEKRLSILREESYNWLKSALATPASKAKNDFQIMENRQNILANRVNKLSEQVNELKKMAASKPAAVQNIPVSSSPKKAEKNIITDALDMSRCTGCGACAEVCPTKAIEVKQNDRGFLNPVVDRKKCTLCGLCSVKCIALNPQHNNVSEPKCYAVMANDEVRKISSSGGVFTLAAEYILSLGGYVCGAAFDENFELEHIVVDNLNDLDKLRGSKYVQSKAGKIYPQIKELLEQDKYVLFTGMPCQVAGLYSYLNKEYPKLYTIDILCHGITSQKVFDKYRADVLEKDGKKLTDIKFKAKEPWGWHAGVNAYFSDGSKYSVPLERDPYYIAYLNSISKNTACGICTVNRLPRQGDLTIGDFWGIANHDPSLNDGKGTSVVLVNNKAGEELLQKTGEKAAVLKEAPLKAAIAGNHCIEHPYPLTKNNNVFFEYFDKLPFDMLATGCRDNRLYEQKYLELIKTVPKEDMEYYYLAESAAKYSKGRKIVTWIRSGKFERLLKNHFGLEVAFGVSMKKEALKSGYINDFDSLKGQADKYYLVCFDRPYDAAVYKTLNDFGYKEINDFLFRKHKPIVLENLDLSNGNYYDAYGNSVEGLDCTVGKVILRGCNNHIMLGKNIPTAKNLSFDISANVNIEIGDHVKFAESIKIECFGWNDPSAVVIKNNCRFTEALIRLYSGEDGTSVIINEYCTFENQFRIHANQSKKIIIGRDCMVSNNVKMMAGDGHTIFSVKSRQPSNFGRDLPARKNQLIIGDHVWVGRDSFIMHGANVGSGSIIGARAFVKSVFPNNCSIGGNPASKISQDIAWSRDLQTQDINTCGRPEYVALTSDAKAPISGLNVLVVGGTRFMGVQLVRELINRGNIVTIATRGNVKDNFGMYVNRLRMDVSDAESVKAALSGKYFDVVFDNIAYCSIYANNVLSNVRCGKYIQLSSVEAYADLIVDMKEEHFDPYKLTVELCDQRAGYVKGKQQAEAVVYQKHSNVPAVTVRIPYVTKTERLYYYCNHVVKQLPMNIPDISKGFTFIRDTEVGKFLPWLAAQDYKGPINLASEGMVTVKQILDYIESKVGKKAVIDTKNGSESPFNVYKEKTFSMNMDKAKTLGYNTSNIDDWFWKLMDEYIARAQKEK